MKKKIAALGLVLVFWMQVCGAAADFAPLYMRYLQNMQSGPAIEATLTASLLEMSPFTKERLDPFNRLLKRMKLVLTLSGDEADGRTDAQLWIGAQAPIAWRVDTQNGQETLYTNLLPERALVFSDSGSMAALFGADDAMEGLGDLLDGEGLFTLPDALTRLRAVISGAQLSGKSAKGGKKLLGLVSSASSITCTLPLSDAQALYQSLQAAAQSSFLQSAFDRVKLSGETVKLTRCFLKDGTEAGLILAFACELDGVPRKGELTWAYADTQEGQAGALEWISTAMDGKDKRVFTANFETSDADNVSRLNAKASVSYTATTQKCSETVEAAFSTVPGEGNERFLGQLQRMVKTGEATETVVLSPHVVTVDYGNDMAMSGSLRIKTLKNSAVMLDAQVDFTLAAPDEEAKMLSFAAQDAQNVSGPDLEALCTRMAQEAVKRIVPAVLALPKEDLTLITQFISDAGLDTVLARLTKTIPMP